MVRSIFIDTGESFYHVKCSSVSYVYYDGHEVLYLYTPSNQISFKWYWDVNGSAKYTELSKKVSEFIFGEDSDGDTMKIDIARRNRITVTRKGGGSTENID